MILIGDLVSSRSSWIPVLFSIVVLCSRVLIVFSGDYLKLGFFFFVHVIHLVCDF